MGNSIYATLTRQSGLMKEMQVVANNIANAATTGFKSEGIIFAEHIKRLPDAYGSMSMASAEARQTNQLQGTLSKTGGTFDLAIEGDGFFSVETPSGQRLTRAGSFIPTPDGQIVTADGFPLLDQGGAPVFVPGDATSVAIGADGTLAVDGNPIGQIGVFTPEDPSTLQREDGVRFRVDGAVLPSETGRIVQGFLESSNVDPVGQIARMIEVQRAYEMGQSFLEREDQRLRSIFNLVAQ